MTHHSHWQHSCPRVVQDKLWERAVHHVFSLNSVKWIQTTQTMPDEEESIVTTSSFPAASFIFCLIAQKCQDAASIPVTVSSHCSGNIVTRAWILRTRTSVNLHNPVMGTAKVPAAVCARSQHPEKAPDPLSPQQQQPANPQSRSFFLVQQPGSEVSPSSEHPGVPRLSLLSHAYLLSPGISLATSANEQKGILLLPLPLPHLSVLLLTRN